MKDKKYRTNNINKISSNGIQLKIDYFSIEEHKVLVMLWVPFVSNVLSILPIILPKPLNYPPKVNTKKNSVLQNHQI